MPKPRIDIGLIVPLREELEALRSVFPVIKEAPSGTQYSATLQSGSSDASMVVFLQDAPGKASAVTATESLLSEYDVGVVVVLGIAGALSDDLSIGDVCFTGSVIDVQENQKIIDEPKKRGVRIEFSTKFHSTDDILSFSVKYLSISEELRPIYEEWRETCYFHAGGQITGQFIGRRGLNEDVGIPACYDGPLVSGPVSKSQIFNSHLKDIDRKLLAIETESGGVFATAKRLGGVPAIAIRGISDYADENKGKLEATTKGGARRVAAFNAVQFLKTQLRNPQFLRLLDERRAQSDAAGLVLFPRATAEETVAGALSAVGDSIDTHLRALCPEYVLKPKGYRLPLPRVHVSERDAGSGSPMHDDRTLERVSILEAVVAGSVVSLDVPRTYPDSSLPWLIAAELALIEIDGKQVLPVVINGSDIGPPSQTLARHTDLDIDALSKCSAAQLVFVLDEAPTGSRSKTSFLLSEMSKYPGARFILLDRIESGLDYHTDLLMRAGATQYNLSEISFFALSEFFQTNFALDDQEASVLALKMRQLFARFSLKAHPGYFAGLGSELLTALLHANRRAELIQLAVDGFLTLVVALDRGKLRLSRTTRERFLGLLVRNIRLEKCNFDQSNLVAFADKFLKENDYDIDAIEFIRTYIEKGIIHFENGVVKLTLPFMGSYLLANELVADAPAAHAYFDLDEENFDFSTFDLYSELGPSPAVVDGVLVALGQATASLKNHANDEPALFTDELHPRLLDRPGRLRDIRRRLDKAAADVMGSRPNSREKQHLLDLAETIQAKAKAATEVAARRGDADAKAETPFANANRVWSIGCVLLGAGAEFLGTDTKRLLAQRVVECGTALLDASVRSQPRVDWDPVRAELAKDEALRKLFSISDDKEVPPQLKELVQVLIDAFEFTYLGQPLRAILQYVADTANNKVLAASIAKVPPGGRMENLIASIWQAELDATKAKPALLDAIRNLPPAAFLRLSLAVYFMARVYWNQWEPRSRLALLEAATESVEPLSGVRIDSARLKRIVGVRSTKPARARKSKKARKSGARAKPA